MPSANPSTDFAPTEPLARVAAAATLPRHWVPGLCAVCRSWQHQAVCTACLQRFAPARHRCLRCALPLPAGPGQGLCGRCLRSPPPQQRSLAALDYGFPWDRLIAGVKFHDQVPWVRPLGDLLAQTARHALRHEGLARPDALVPVPMTPARLRDRGVHHAGMLARRVAQGLRLPVWDTRVIRRHEAPAQLGLDREARQRNVRDAFEVPPAARATLQGRCLAVVDDVMTTGATTAALARALREAGAAEVQVWVAARVPEATRGP